MINCPQDTVQLHFENISIELPNLHLHLRPGCKLKLGRFESATWQLQFGWYIWGGNRPTCGWYLLLVADPKVIKPLQLPDLQDIYLVEQ